MPRHSPLGTLAQRATAADAAREAKLAKRRARRKARREDAKAPPQLPPAQRRATGRPAPTAAPPSAPAKPRRGAGRLPSPIAPAPVGAKGPKTDPKPTPRRIRAVPPASIDPFDPNPTAAVPGAYLMRYASQADHETGSRMGLHPCLAYQRSNGKVYAIVLGPPVEVQIFDGPFFDLQARPLMLRLLGQSEIPYPLDRAVRQYLDSFNGHTDKALRVLKRLKAGRPPDEEDTIEDLLDMEPSVSPTTKVKVKRQAVSKDAKLEARRAKRQKKLAGMTDAQRAAWLKDRRDARKARRKLRRERKAA